MKMNRYLASGISVFVAIALSLMVFSVVIIGVWHAALMWGGIMLLVVVITAGSVLITVGVEKLKQGDSEL